MDGIIRNIGLLIGGMLAIVACPSFELALMLFAALCVIDDIGWIYVYVKCRKAIVQNEY